MPREGNAAPPPLLFRTSPRCRVTPGKARSVGRGRRAGRAPPRGRVGSRARRRECGARDPLPGRALSAHPGSAQEAEGEPQSYLGGPGAAPGARATAAPWTPCGAPGGRLCPGAAGSALLTGQHRDPSVRCRCLALSDLGAVPHSRSGRPLALPRPLLAAGTPIPSWYSGRCWRQEPSRTEQAQNPNPAGLSSPRTTELCMEFHSNCTVTFRQGGGGGGGAK